MKIKLSTKKESGFTLIEALVAILILTMGIIPSFSIVLIANGLATSIANNLAAVNLAQEGIEVIRSIRDSNWINGQPFNSGLADGDYRVDWNTTSGNLMSISVNPPLKISTSGLYNYTTGADTAFSRKITITNIVSACNCELMVVSEVSWQEKKVNRSFKVESHLFDWK